MMNKSDKNQQTNNKFLVLGEGTYGKVYKGYRKSDNLPLAIK